MLYREINHDLFTVNSDSKLVGNGQPFGLAHCISADFAMAGGIVLEFNNRYNMKERLVSYYGNVRNKFRQGGGFVITEKVAEGNVSFPVYNLITKEKVTQQPTYENIEKALEDMLFEMEFGDQNRVAMPMIGCGIDGKDWDRVSAIIQQVFETSDIEILICKRD